MSVLTSHNKVRGSAAPLVVAALMLSACHVAGTGADGGGHDSPSMCAVPSAATMHAVNELLDTPPDPIVTASYRDRYGDLDKKLWTYKKRQAEKLGLTVVHTAPIADKIEDAYYDALYADEKLPDYADAEKKANRSLRKLGIVVRASTAKDPGSGVYIWPPSKKDLNEYGTPVLADILRKVDGMPKELYQPVGPQGLTIKLATSFDLASAQAGTIYVNIYEKNTAEALPHELIHTLEDKGAQNGGLCQGGDAANDPGFAGLHGGEPRLYNQRNKKGKAPNLDGKHPSYRTKATKLHELSKAATHAAKDGNIAKYCKTVKAETKLKESLLSWTDYHPNIGEDRADTGGMVLNPSSYKLVDPTMPIPKAKFDMMAGRMYELNPAVLTYLVSLRDPFKKPKRPHVSC